MPINSASEMYISWHINSLVIISVSSSIYLQFWYCLIPIGSLFSYSLTNIYLLFIFLSLILFDKSTGAGL